LLSPVGKKFLRPNYPIQFLDAEESSLVFIMLAMFLLT